MYSPDEYYRREIEKGLKQLDKRVIEEMERIILSKTFHMVHTAQKCKSPIEQLIAIHLHDYLESFSAENGAKTFIYIQYPIEIGQATYIPDFLIECIYQGKTHWLAVECDGHEFHEKTKEQAARDKRRDRDMVKKGITVLRFTGSEIWKDTSKCMNEIYDTLLRITGIQDEIDKFINETIG